MSGSNGTPSVLFNYNFAVTSADHLFSKVSDNLKLLPPFLCKVISLETLQQLEKSSLLGSDYGLEVITVQV